MLWKLIVVFSVWFSVPAVVLIALFRQEVRWLTRNGYDGSPATMPCGPLPFADTVVGATQYVSTGHPWTKHVQAALRSVLLFAVWPVWVWHIPRLRQIGAAQRVGALTYLDLLFVPDADLPRYGLPVLPQPWRWVVALDSLGVEERRFSVAAAINQPPPTLLDVLDVYFVLVLLPDAVVLEGISDPSALASMLHQFPVGDFQMKP